MYKVGETVSCKRYFHKDKIGKIILILNNNQLGIDFGEGFEGHNLNGHINTNTGWYIFSDYVDKTKNNNLGDY